jgi:hypothetical protein
VSASTLRQATVADVAAMSRIGIAVKENALPDPARITEATDLAALRMTRDQNART